MATEKEVGSMNNVIGQAALVADLKDSSTSLGERIAELQAKLADLGGIILFAFDNIECDDEDEVKEALLVALQSLHTLDVEAKNLAVFVSSACEALKPSNDDHMPIAAE